MKMIRGFINSIFANRYGRGTINNVPSIMPPAALDNIRNGNLSEINTNTIFLSSGEKCHYIDRAILVTERNIITGYTGNTSGWSFRVFKGVNYRIGGKKGKPIREDVREYTKGILYITNQRVVFASHKKGFVKTINSISVITPYANAITLQFGSSTYSLLIPDGNIVFKIFNLLKP